MGCETLPRHAVRIVRLWHHLVISQDHSLLRIAHWLHQRLPLLLGMASSDAVIVPPLLWRSCTAADAGLVSSCAITSLKRTNLWCASTAPTRASMRLRFV